MLTFNLGSTPYPEFTKLPMKVQGGGGGGQPPPLIPPLLWFAKLPMKVRGEGGWGGVSPPFNPNPTLVAGPYVQL